MNPTLSTILGVVGAIISAVSITFVIITFAINRRRELKKDTETATSATNDINKSLIELKLTLAQVNTNTIETRADVKAMNKQIGEHGEQIAVMKSDISKAQKDIENLQRCKVDK